MTVEHTPQCDKITCKAYMHSSISLALHGEIAHKGLINYVYDDDNSIFSPPEVSPRAKLFVQQNHPLRSLGLKSRTIGSLTGRTSSSSVCTSRPERRCSHQMEPRNVQSILITLAENVLRKSLMHPQVEIQTFLKTIGDLHPRQINR